MPFILAACSTAISDGLTYVSPQPPEFAQPFVGVPRGTQYPQQFPLNVPPYNVSATNPFTANWSQYEPINGAVSYFYKNRTPYAMTGNLTIEPEKVRPFRQ